MEDKRQINVLSILRQSVKFNAVNVFSKLISIPKSIIVAMVLVPEEYGVIGFLSLWSMYAGWIHPGVEGAAGREMAYLFGKGEKKKALHLQNVAITVKFLYSFVPFLVMMGASFFYSNDVIRIGLIITAISYFISTNTNYWPSFNHIRQRFNEVATGYLIRGITVPLVTVALIYWLRLYAVLIAPIVAQVLIFFYYIKKAGIDARFEVDWKETVKLIKIGLPLSLLGIVYWGYRIADRTMIAGFLSLHEMGLYTYAIGMVTFAILFFEEFGKVLQPILWTNLGRAKNHIDGFSPVYRMAVYMSLVTSLSICIIQPGFFLLVNVVTTKYIDSIPVFNVLSFNIFFMTMAVFPNIVLNSSVVNKQVTNTKIWFIGLLMNVFFNYVAIKMGYGITGVSFVTIIIQGFVLLWLFSAIRNYLFTGLKEFFGFMRRILFPPLVSFIIYLLTIHFRSFVSNPFLYSFFSVIFSLMVWVLVFRLFYKDYFPKKKIINLIQEFGILIKNMVNKRGNHQKIM